MSCSSFNYFGYIDTIIPRNMLISNTSSTYARRTLISNLATKIMSQQDDIILMPGHGPPTTLAAEKNFNEAFLKGPIEDIR